MRKWVVLGAVLAMCGSGYAELLNVEVGGQIRIRGRYWGDALNAGASGPFVDRIEPFLLPNRPIGPLGTASRYDWDSEGHNTKYLEEKTRLRAKAVFSEDVSALIELESFDLWGSDFRSDYRTGTDRSAVSLNDIEVLHAYIQIDNLFDTPFRLRAGRQDIKLGKGWLINDLITACISMSHDGLRLTYDTDDFTIDAFSTKLFEAGSAEEDGDVDFYGVYGTYKALEPVDISLYWLMVRDARSLNDTDASWDVEWVEDWLSLDDYDPTNLHTVGTRVFGKTGAVDYDLELAYQFGEADASSVGFKQNGYGDDDNRYDAWAGDFEAGYSFDVAWHPRLFAGAAYFSGEDNRDLSVFEWLNPFDRAEASVSFNRLFSGKGYAWTYDVYQNTSNFWQARVGVDAKPLEKVTAQLLVAYQAVNEPFDLPRMLHVGRYRVPVWPELAFWTEESSKDLGFMTYTWAQYNYTEDVYIRVGWEHLFTGDGFEDGSFTDGHGLFFHGGTDGEGSDYVFFDMGMSF